MRPSTLLAIVAATVVSAALLAPALIYPYFEDAALFAAVANYMLDGQALYSEVFDHKAPAIYLQLSLSYLLDIHKVSIFSLTAPICPKQTPSQPLCSPTPAMLPFA